MLNVDDIVKVVFCLLNDVSAFNNASNDVVSIFVIVGSVMLLYVVISLRRKLFIMNVSL
jgi:hypothetical protein